MLSVSRHICDREASAEFHGSHLKLKVLSNESGLNQPISVGTGAISVPNGYGTPTLAREGFSAVLVLTRKIGESFVVGDEIKITIVDVIGGNKVRVGIEAPQEVPIYREEIWELIKNENQQAARSDANDLPDV